MEIPRIKPQIQVFHLTLQIDLFEHHCQYRIRLQIEMLLDSVNQVQKVVVKLPVTLNAPQQAISVVIPVI